jgi:hypothetical protein
LSRAAFSEREGVPLSTLDWWLRRCREETEPPGGVVFEEVPAPVLGVDAGEWAMEVVSPGGWRIRSREVLNVTALVSLLRVRKC